MPSFTLDSTQNILVLRRWYIFRPMHNFSRKVCNNNQPPCCFLFPELTVMHEKALPVLFSNHASSDFPVRCAYQCRRGGLAKTNILQMSSSYGPSPFAAMSRELQCHLIFSLHCQTTMKGYFPMHLVTAGGDEKAIYNKWSLLSNNNIA